MWMSASQRREQYINANAVQENGKNEYGFRTLVGKVVFAALKSFRLVIGSEWNGIYIKDLMAIHRKHHTSRMSFLAEKEKKKSF